MARRSPPERMYQAKRSALVERLVSAGVLRVRAEADLKAHESAEGRVTDWEAVWRALRPF
jgi:hypothetical protein